jgi:hypothetical protein
MSGGRYLSNRLAILSAVTVVTILTAACGGADEPDAPVAAAPTAVVSSPAVASAAGKLECDPGQPIAEQKAVLVAVASDHFDGVTAEEISRLFYTPDARDRRQGGIWVTLEFVIDDFETVAKKKSDMDMQMRDAYERLYTAGCDELTQVDLSGRAMTEGSQVGRGGGNLKSPVVVYKTKLEIGEADAVDWANKESLDFNEIWDEVLLNPRWRDELEGQGD